MLFATTANDGHFDPVASLASACAVAGHEVRVAAPESFAAAVGSRGFVHLPFADAPAHLIGPVMQRLPQLSFEEANAVVVRDVFAGIDAQAAFPALATMVDEWRPQVVIRDPAEFGSLAAAVRAGIPHLKVAIGMAEMVLTLADLAAERLIDLARAAGLDDGALQAADVAEPAFSPVPESLDRAGDPGYLDATVTMRYRVESARIGRTPVAAAGSPDLPLVYVTFGSVTGSLPTFAGVYREALDGLADLPVRVFMTVGRRIDVDSLGPLPGNATVEQWWPQAEVLSEASLVLGHGGFGTTMGAILAGVPQVVAPLFTLDQAVNARHVHAAGAGRGFAPGPDVVARACAAVPEVLADLAFGTNAAVIAADAHALPPVATVVGAIADMAGSAVRRDGSGAGPRVGGLRPGTG